MVSALFYGNLKTAFCMIEAFVTENPFKNMTNVSYPWEMLKGLK